ncbi:MAG: DUF131 domain-containing protein [Candidatus Aenigmarchaeota archaeon]|jgi:uncharacterized protein (TIGR00304 family)|nr:DUF131 domain-containing protein [Candidatus Aenigmarchaeota archaeon]
MELIGLALISIGIFAIVVGLLILAFSKSTKVEGGGVVLVGPLPIIFGSSERIVYIVLAITLTIIMLLYLFIILFSWR